MKYDDAEKVMAQLVERYGEGARVSLSTGPQSVLVGETRDYGVTLTKLAPIPVADLIAMETVAGEVGARCSVHCPDPDTLEVNIG